MRSEPTFAVSAVLWGQQSRTFPAGFVANECPYWQRLHHPQVATITLNFWGIQDDWNNYGKTNFYSMNIRSIVTRNILSRRRACFTCYVAASVAPFTGLVRICFWIAGLHFTPLSFFLETGSLYFWNKLLNTGFVENIWLTKSAQPCSSLEGLISAEALELLDWVLFV